MRSFFTVFLLMVVASLEASAQTELVYQFDLNEDNQKCICNQLSTQSWNDEAERFIAINLCNLEETAEVKEEPLDQNPLSPKEDRPSPKNPYNHREGIARPVAPMGDSYIDSPSLNLFIIGDDMYEYQLMPTNRDMLYPTNRHIELSPEEILELEKLMSELSRATQKLLDDMQGERTQPRYEYTEDSEAENDDPLEGEPDQGMEDEESIEEDDSDKEDKPDTDADEKENPEDQENESEESSDEVDFDQSLQEKITELLQLCSV